MYILRVLCVIYYVIAQSDGKTRRPRTTLTYEEYWGPTTTFNPITTTEYWYPVHQNKPKQNQRDWVSATDKRQLIEFSEELISEAYYSFKQVDQIEEICRGMVPFEVGIAIGTIREKYNKMMDIYTHYNSHFTAKSLLYPPAAMGEPYKSGHFLASYEKIHQLEIDIEKRIEMLESIPRDTLELDLVASIKSMMESQVLGTSGRRAAARVAESRFKSQMRQQYLMRKLHLPANMSTTKKRFIDKWPVEETWDQIVLKGY